MRGGGDQACVHVCKRVCVCARTRTQMNIFKPASDVCAPSMLQRRSLQLISLTSGPTPGVVADFSLPLLIFAAQQAREACGRPESSASLLRWGGPGPVEVVGGTGGGRV